MKNSAPGVELKATVCEHLLNLIISLWLPLLLCQRCDSLQFGVEVVYAGDNDVGAGGGDGGEHR